MSATLSKPAWHEACDHLLELLGHEETADYLPPPWPAENAELMQAISIALERGEVVRIPRLNRSGTSEILAAGAVFAAIKGKAPLVLLLTQRWHQAHGRQKEIVRLLKLLRIRHHRSSKGAFVIPHAGGQTIIEVGPLDHLPNLLGRNGNLKSGLLVDRLYVENAIARAPEHIRQCVLGRMALEAPNNRTLWAVYATPARPSEGGG